jgi:hypothetical protein
MGGSRVTKDFKRVVWEWLPGVVAGFMPLFVFILVKAHVIPPVPPEATKSPEAMAHFAKVTAGHFWYGLTEHLIVFSIVASSVSTFTSFPRLFSESLEDAPIGRASLGLVMAITLILVFSVAMYALHEARVTGNGVTWTAGIVVLVTLGVSLYMEFAIANLRLARHAARRAAVAQAPPPAAMAT